MVEFVDGSTIAQAGPPRDARCRSRWVDLAGARLQDADVRVRLARAQSWEFEPLDDEAFPAVRLARRVGEAGGTWPAVYNAANEVSSTPSTRGA